MLRRALSETGFAQYQEERGVAEEYSLTPVQADAILKMTLGQLFPEHPASQKVPDPVFVGGPMNASVLFAIVKSKARPGGKLLQLLPDVYMAFDSDTVDRIIEGGGQARYLAGLVAWQPGELRSELRRGAWHILEADPALITRKPDGMWEELLRRAEFRANGI